MIFSVKKLVYDVIRGKMNIKNILHVFLSIIFFILVNAHQRQKNVVRKAQMESLSQIDIDNVEILKITRVPAAEVRKKLPVQYLAVSSMDSLSY